MIKIYTDGACQVHKGNKGGWAFVMVDKNTVVHGSGCVLDTTNNKMEIIALLEALQMFKIHYPEAKELEIYSDSQYVINSASIWLPGWLRINFRGKKNKELWLKYQELSKGLKIEYVWVKGHSGDYYNELADGLATEAITSIKPEKYKL